MISIQDALTQCLRNIKLQLSENTYREYKHALKIFASVVTDAEIKLSDDCSKLTFQFLRDYPINLLEREYTKRTNGVYLAAVSYFIDWMSLHDISMLGEAQVYKIKKSFSDAKKKQEYNLPRFPKDGQAEAVVKAAENDIGSPTITYWRDLAIILFLHSSGCRNDEVARLKVNDLDLDECYAKVTGKGSKQRIVYFSVETKKAILNYWELRTDTSKATPAFIRYDKNVGKRIARISTATIRQIVAHYTAIAGIEKGRFTPHSFRHSFALNMLRNTGNLAIVQDLLGHRSPQATRIYTTISNDELKKAHKQAYG